MNDSKRIMIAALGSVLILFAWNEFFMPKKPAARKRAPGRARAGGAHRPAGGRRGRARPRRRPRWPRSRPSTPEETVVLETPEFRATFTSWGGALKSLVLKEETYRKRGKGEAPDLPIDLVHVRAGQPWPLSLLPSAELGGGSDPGTDPLVRAPMRIVAKDARSVTFEGQARRGRRAQDLPGRRAPLPDRPGARGGRRGEGRDDRHPLPGLPGPRRPHGRLLLGRRGLRVGDPGLPGRGQDRALRRQGRRWRCFPVRRAGWGSTSTTSSRRSSRSRRTGSASSRRCPRQGRPWPGCASRWTAPPAPPSSSTRGRSRSTCCAPTGATSRPPSTTARSPTTSPSSPGSCSG